MAACMDAGAGPLVLMLVRTNYATDARVTKEAVSLVRGGYRVKVLAAWEVGLPRREVVEGVRVLRPPHRLAYAAGRALGFGGGVPSGSGARSSPLRQWLYAAAAAVDAALFALHTLVQALRERPAVIHAHDLNVLPGAWIAITVATVWWTIGFNTVIFLTALQEIPKSLYEAASIDGANSNQQFWLITLPMLRSVLVFVLTITLIASANLFGQPYLMTGGGPVKGAETVIHRIFIEGILRSQMGSAAAMSIVMALLLLTLTYLNFKFFGQTEES